MDARILTTLNSPRFKWCLFVGLIFFFIGVSVQYTVKIQTGKRDNRSAFLRWRNQIKDLDNREDIYIKHNYPNTPIMAILLRPLAGMDRISGSLLWFFLKVAMMLIVYFWVCWLAESPDRPFPVWARALAIGLSLRPVIGDLTHGNINLFICFLVIASLFAFRHKRDFLSGLLLSLAIVCKVTPALFVPYFLWKRAWTTLAGCAVGMVLFLWIVPGMLIGFDYNQFLLGQWTKQMVVPYVVEGKVTTEHQNQSLPGMMHRLLTKEPSFTVWTEDGYKPVAHHNFVDLNREWLRWILKGFLLLFVAVVAWSCRTSIKPDSGSHIRSENRLAIEYSLILLGMLLFSERTWKHHCVTLILPMAVIVYHLSAHILTKRQWRFLFGSLVITMCVIMSTSSGPFGKAADALAELCEVYGAHVWAHLILVATLVILLRWRKDALPSGEQHSDTKVMGMRVILTDPPDGTEAEHTGMRNTNRLAELRDENST